MASRQPKKQRGPTYWQTLKDAGIERPYERRDIEEMLRKPPGSLKEAQVYSPEFQRQFIAGIRECLLHPYRQVYHVTISSSCPKCAGE